LDRDEEGGGGYDADPASSCTGSSLLNNLHPPNTAIWRGSAATRPLAPAFAAARAYVVERRDESLGQVDVWSTQLASNVSAGMSSALAKRSAASWS
jgi:hypothetical protein